MKGPRIALRLLIACSVPISIGTCATGATQPEPLLPDPQAVHLPSAASDADPSAVPPQAVPDEHPSIQVPPDPEIEELLGSLSLRQRIGQRFIAYIPGDRVAYGAGRAINSVAPAGFIVYPWNFRTADDVRKLTDSLQFVASMATPGISLLLCTDQEGGRVDTFRFQEFARFPSAGSLGRTDDMTVIRAAAYITARQLAGLGLNMNLAPVLDVYDIADDSIIGDRSYGGDPFLVSRIVEPYLDGTRAAGVIPTAKHFPGHGVTSVDSHAMLPVVATTRDQLANRDLVPFRRAIELGVESIMTAHILYENIDPLYPATLSEVFLSDILRGELGYTGVVITDGLEMGAIRDNFDLAITLTRLLTLDVDLILLYTQYDVVAMVDLVEDLIDAGDISVDDIDRGVRRVLALKRAYGLANVEDL